MKVGTAWEDITPDKPVALLGQMHIRMGEYTRDPLTVNAVAFADGQTTSVVVSVDVCYLTDEIVHAAQKSCEETCGIPGRSVLIAATHTHVAPCTTSAIVGDPDPEFMSRLHEAIVQAVFRSIEDLEETTIYAGAGHLEHMGWNRRGMRKDGKCHMYYGSWREDFVGIEGPRDGQVGVLWAQREDGTVKAVVTSFSTHPNCVEGESYYSADIPGQVRKVLREVLGENTGVVYLTGAAGNTAPSIMVNNKDSIQPWRGESGLVRSGRYLSGEILKVIAEQTVPMTDLLKLEQMELQIPMREWDAHADLSEFGGGMLQFFEESRDNWSQQMQEDNPVPVRVNVVRVGDAVICTNPSELYVEFGLAIKERSPAKVTLIGQLTDGGVGYIPTPEAILHGGYSAMSARHTRLVPEAGWMIVEETERMLNDAFTN